MFKIIKVCPLLICENSFNISMSLFKKYFLNCGRTLKSNSKSLGQTF